MFWRILKKDLKHKKIMNIILLLFVILCSMFAAAAVNNVIAVTGGIEHYFDVADVPDVTVMTRGKNDVGERIGEFASVREMNIEHWLSVSISNFKKSMHYNPFAYLHSEKDILKLVTESKFPFLHVGYTVLGIGIERVSGLKYTEYIQNVIAKPLGIQIHFL